MGNLHQVVVNDHRQVVSGKPVRFEEDKIIQGLQVKDHLSPQVIPDGDLPLLRYLKADNRLFPLFKIFPANLRGQLPAMPVIAITGAPQFLQAFRGAKAVIGLAPGHQVLGMPPVKLNPFRLLVRPGRAAHIRPLVPVEPQPAQALHNILHRLRDIARAVRIFNAQKKKTLLLLGQKPIVKGRSRTTDMEVSSGTWSKSHSNSCRQQQHPIRKNTLTPSASPPKFLPEIPLYTRYTRLLHAHSAKRLM